MTTQPIILIPDSVLRQKCAPVASIDDRIKALVDDMFETMYEAPGIGLAACQIGVLERVIVVDVAGKDEPQRPIALINPEIVWQSEERSVYQEGCLSIPDIYEDVERPAACRVRYADLEGRENEIEASGLLSTCVQHEVDHLNGVLFIDYISKLKRDRVMKKFTKLARQRGSSAA